MQSVFSYVGTEKSYGDPRGPEGDLDCFAVLDLIDFLPSAAPVLVVSSAHRIQAWEEHYGQTIELPLGIKQEEVTPELFESPHLLQDSSGLRLLDYKD